MKYLFATALLLVAAIVAGNSAIPDAVIYPSIQPVQSEAEPIPVDATFTFEGQPASISVTVDGALYAGAASANKTVTRFGNARKNDWINDYFPSFIDEPRQAAFFDALVEEFRRIRDERGLDADRYAELMTCFVQSIEYRTDPNDAEPKFPVETFVEQSGDCDDKTLLLAALLSHEGYDVAVLLFRPERHVALGIRSAGIEYEHTGYAYVETTTRGFIGMVPEHFAGGLVLASKPEVFPIGTGVRTYTAGDEVETILQGRDQASAEAVDLAQNIARTDADLQRMEAEVQAERERLDVLRAQGRADEYDSLAGAYRQLVERYNAVMAERNSLAERHNRLVDICRVIIEGLDNRAGTFAVIISALG